MSEHDFRRIRECGRIDQVTAKMEMTGDDTSREWIEVRCGDGKMRVLPRNWEIALKFVGHWSGPGAFELTYEGRRMADSLKEIDAWEANSKRERETYERLKKKFEPEADSHG
jgi:hypothetical protein